MKYELASDAYRAQEHAIQLGTYGVPGRLWKHRNGNWYVLYGPRLRKQVSTRTKDLDTAKGFMSRFFAR